MHLKRSKNPSPVLLILPTALVACPATREQIAQLFFERFNVQGLHVSDEALMAIYGYGQHLTGLVVRLGERAVCVTGVVDTSVDVDSVVYCPGGLHRVRTEIRRVLAHDQQFKNEYGSDVIDTDLVELILREYCEFKAVDVAVASAIGLGAIGTTATTAAAAAAVTPSPSKKKEPARFSITFKDKKLTLPREVKYQPVEFLFNSTADGDSLSVAEAIHHVMMHTDPAKRVSLLDNICLTGPGCFIKGMPIPMTPTPSHDGHRMASAHRNGTQVPIPRSNGLLRRIPTQGLQVWQVARLPGEREGSTRDGELVRWMYLCQGTLSSSPLSKLASPACPYDASTTDGLTWMNGMVDDFPGCEELCIQGGL